MRHHLSAADADTGIVGKTDQVERACEVGPLEWLTAPNPQDAVSEQAETCAPVDLPESIDEPAASGLIVVRDGLRQAEDRSDRRPGLLQPHGRFGRREMNSFGRDGSFVGIDVTGGHPPPR